MVSSPAMSRPLHTDFSYLHGSREHWLLKSFLAWIKVACGVGPMWMRGAERAPSPAL